MAKYFYHEEIREPAGKGEQGKISVDKTAAFEYADTIKVFNDSDRLQTVI